MATRMLNTVLIAASALALFSFPRAATAQSKEGAATMGAAKTQIPASVRREHEEIHALLVEATRAPGRVGAAAKALASVLDPHFVREEQIALPPLGLLAPLANRASLSAAQVSEVLAMTDALRRELPGMLEEHKRIRAAVTGLREAAKAENAARFEHLADQLAAHAQTEEEVLYPAAIVVGDLIRATRQTK